MINFDTIDSEIAKNSNQKNCELVASEQIINSTVDLVPFIHASENFQVTSKITAETCLSMTLQARKMRQALDRSRAEIIKPHIDFQKAVNKMSKDYEKKLLEIEESLSEKVIFWLENPMCFDIDKLSVEDGCLSKKIVIDYEVMDETLIEREFLTVDTKKIELAIKNGLLKIEGVRIFERYKIDLRIKN